METFQIIKLKGNKREETEDFITEEVPFTLILDDKELVTLLCTPYDLEDLVRGFLFTSGVIKKAADIKKIVIDKQRWAAYVQLSFDIGAQDLVFKRLFTSGCGRGTVFYNVADMLHRSKLESDLKVKSGDISKVMGDFHDKSHLFLKTGGVHSAALSNGKEVLIFKEDIGRHNALDKIIGQALLEEISLDDKILLTSGRISSEVLFKTQKCKVPIVVSRSAPTNQAVNLSRDMNITLIGFARGGRMNIYSVPERIEVA